MHRCQIDPIPVRGTLLGRTGHSPFDDESVSRMMVVVSLPCGRSSLYVEESTKETPDSAMVSVWKLSFVSVRFPTTFTFFDFSVVTVLSISIVPASMSDEVNVRLEVPLAKDQLSLEPLLVGVATAFRSVWTCR